MYLSSLYTYAMSSKIISAQNASLQKNNCFSSKPVVHVMDSGNLKITTEFDFLFFPNEYYEK